MSIAVLRKCSDLCVDTLARKRQKGDVSKLVPQSWFRPCSEAMQPGKIFTCNAYGSKRRMLKKMQRIDAACTSQSATANWAHTLQKLLEDKHKISVVKWRGQRATCPILPSMEAIIVRLVAASWVRRSLSRRTFLEWPRTQVLAALLDLTRNIVFNIERIRATWLSAQINSPANSAVTESVSLSKKAPNRSKIIITSSVCNTWRVQMQSPRLPTLQKPRIIWDTQSRACSTSTALQIKASMTV